MKALDRNGRELEVGLRVRHVGRREQRRRADGGEVVEIRRLVCVDWPRLGDGGWYRPASLELIENKEGSE